ncbi:hypothetical protein GGI25_003047 [Coemansia spiralis]|uniref:Uncharacterized protein n=2 Tax=Coemansia TaxID=4863 RepID=A0A9W8KYH6_9FUNG|nr:hypothetical protein BX070DRAFT_255610 [Coemansia spiralis]KAJ1992127.1 hypothetical protein EDC05_002956 [Coemansia umbellata]KAJ2622052.1 hypothetical protein GGI26_003628 [Coemansia sp. RSA 1358]KAJ2677657.1 hypothetical protein GGI25_003047 [Coemansia spiralis]
MSKSSISDIYKARKVKSEQYAPSLKPNSTKTRSHPNIALQSTKHDVNQAYADLYDYQSDSSVESARASHEEPSPPRTIVLRFDHAPRLPAVKVGAARLSSMVRKPASNNNSNKKIDPPEPIMRHESVKHTEEPFRNPAPIENPYQEEEESMELPSRLVRGATIKATKRKSTEDPAPLPNTEFMMLDGDEFNGLLAPGALGDEKQRAQADGGWLHRFLSMIRGGNIRHREALLFKPMVPQEAKEELELEHTASKFPFCCCPARFCVAITFVSILLGALAGFFVWPRVPTMSISSLTALAPARVIYNTRDSQFGIQMPLRITYEVHSGNFYPLHINSAHVLGFDGVTGNRIIDTTLKAIPVLPLRLQFHDANTTIHYLTSDMNDPALADLFGKCAPATMGNRVGALTIRFQIKVDVAHLAWFSKQPIVTLNQKIECPQ